jgi:hypothetical protein
MQAVNSFVGALALVGCFAMAAVPLAQADGGKPKICQRDPLKPFAKNPPFLLNDPRSGLMLYLESDGRHMSAIARDGKIAWHRDLFDDPRLPYAFPPPPQIVGEPQISDAQWLRKMRAYVGKLSIGTGQVVSECEAQAIDHSYSSPLFRGHYISLDGGRIEFLLDAKTGDILVGAMN